MENPNLIPHDHGNLHIGVSENGIVPSKSPFFQNGDSEKQEKHKIFGIGVPIFRQSHIHPYPTQPTQNVYFESL